MTKSGIKAKRRRDLKVDVDVEMIWIEIGYANKEWKGLLVGLGYRKPMLARGDFIYVFVVQQRYLLCCIYTIILIFVGDSNSLWLHGFGNNVFQCNR